jgi:hypothetical protein
LFTTAYEGRFENKEMFCLAPKKRFYKQQWNLYELCEEAIQLSLNQDFSLNSIMFSSNANMYSKKSNRRRKNQTPA